MRTKIGEILSMYFYILILILCLWLLLYSLLHSDSYNYQQIIERKQMIRSRTYAIFVNLTMGVLFLSFFVQLGPIYLVLLWLKFSIHHRKIHGFHTYVLFRSFSVWVQKKFSSIITMYQEIVPRKI